MKSRRHRTLILGRTFIERFVCMRRLVTGLSLLLAIAVLAGCGQKGALFLPQPRPATTAPAPAASTAAPAAAGTTAVPTSAASSGG